MSDSSLHSTALKPLKVKGQPQRSKSQMMGFCSSDDEIGLCIEPITLRDLWAAVVLQSEIIGGTNLPKSNPQY